jgi:hypothetical protein
MPGWEYGGSVQLPRAGGGPKDRAMREKQSHLGMRAIGWATPATRRMRVTIQAV